VLLSLERAVSTEAEQGIAAGRGAVPVDVRVVRDLVRVGPDADVQPDAPDRFTPGLLLRVLAFREDGDDGILLAQETRIAGDFQRFFQCSRAHQGHRRIHLRVERQRQPQPLRLAQVRPAHP
jgi:hypothetical protein